MAQVKDIIAYTKDLLDQLVLLDPKQDVGIYMSDNDGNIMVGKDIKLMALEVEEEDVGIVTIAVLLNDVAEFDNG